MTIAPYGRFIGMLRSELLENDGQEMKTGVAQSATTCLDSLVGSTLKNYYRTKAGPDLTILPAVSHTSTGI